MSYAFFAYLSRLKLISRWSLIRSRYARDVDPEHVLSLAVYHDATEVMTGDLPTPVKYHNDELRGAYRRLEDVSADRLLSLLPDDLQPAGVSAVSGIFHHF